MTKSKSLTKRGIRKHIRKQMQRKKKSLRHRGGVSGEKCNGDYSVSITMDDLRKFYNDAQQQQLSLGCLIKYPEVLGRRKRRTLIVEKVNAQHPDFKYLMITYKDSTGTRKDIDIGSAKEILFVPSTGTIEFELRDYDGSFKRLNFKFAVSERPEKGRTAPNQEEQGWIDVFKNIKSKQMSILDQEELKLAQLREKQQAQEQSIEAGKFRQERDELVGYQLPEIQDKVARSYQALQGKSDEELKDLTGKLRADWAEVRLLKSERRDGKMKAERIGHKDKTDVIQKQRCRQAVRDYVQREYAQESAAMREALVYHACVSERASIQEKRFLQGEDLKDSKRRSKEKSAEEDETFIRMQNERRASGNRAYDVDEKLHEKISDDSLIQGYKRSRADYYKELEELAPKIQALFAKVPKDEFAKLQSGDRINLSKELLLKHITEEEFNTLEEHLQRYEKLSDVVERPMSERTLMRMESSRTALTGQTPEDVEAGEQEWARQKDYFSSGRTELGGGTKRRKRKGKNGGKKTRKTRKHRKRNNKKNSKEHNKKSKRNIRQRQTKKGRKGRRRIGRRLRTTKKR